MLTAMVDLARKGPAALEKALGKAEWNQTRLEKELDVTPGTASRWLSGERIPDIASAVALEKILGIPVEVWAKDKQIARDGAKRSA